jgi:glyoxylase-like metal-dependent hydrolase (beta-lactamase superfamily II)
MRGLAIGDVTVTSIVERDGPWRRPEDMFPDYDPELGKRHIAELEPGVFDQASGKMVITYQTFVVRTPRHTILVDTCTGEDKGYAAPMDFPKAPWLEGFRAAGLRFEDIDYVFCTHLHIDHCGWNTVLRDGRWVPTFPRAKYVFHKREYAAWEEATRRGDNPPGNVWRFNCEPVVAAGQALLVDDDFALDDTVWLTPTPGHSPCHCCVNIRSGSARAVVTGDLFHHALQCREPQWSTIFDWDPKQAIASRRRFFGEVAGTGLLLLPIHFPHPTVGRLEADGERFRYSFVR